MNRYLIPLGIFLVLVVFLGIGLGLNPREVPSPLVGKPAPAFRLAELHGNGKVRGKEDMLGQVWLLNVWASWCVSCRDEHPVLTRFAETKRVRIVGFNWKDERTDALRWLDQFGNPYWLVIADLEGKTAIDWGIYGAPETFLVDANGTIRWKHVGPLTDALIAGELLPALEAIDPKGTAP